MIKIAVIAPTGEKIEAEVVRFFDAYGKKYLVYTLNEKDEQGFVKLYVSKIDGSPKALVGEFIEDENEWSVVKAEFKKIIGENNDSGRTTVNDLNPNDLENVNVKGHRVIKLMESYVNLLSANQKQFTAPVAPAQPKMPEPPIMNFEQPATAFPETPSFAPEAPVVPGTNFGYQAPANPFPEAPAYAMNQPEPTVAEFNYQNPVQPQMSVPENQFGYQTPTVPFPEATTYAKSAPATQVPSNNYEEMYNELKAKYDRCNAELEKVTNENIELRIKIDDIREILNEN